MNINTKKLLITGASGRIGEKLVSWLENNTDYELILTSRNKPKYNTTRAEWIQADLNNIADLDRIFDTKPDTVIHLAAAVGIKNSISIIEHENIELNPSINLIQYLVKRQVYVKFIFASSGGTLYRDGTFAHKENENVHCSSLYSCNKIYIEQLLWLYKDLLYPIILRISNPFGMRVNPKIKQGIIDIGLSCALQNNILNIWDDPTNVRDYIYIEDLCLAFYKCLLYSPNKYEIFNIGSGIGLSILEIITMIKKYFPNFNYNINKKNINTIKCNILDISKAKTFLNWAPKIGVEEYIHYTYLSRIIKSNN